MDGCFIPSIQLYPPALAFLRQQGIRTCLFRTGYARRSFQTSKEQVAAAHGLTFAFRASCEWARYSDMHQLFMVLTPLCIGSRTCRISDTEQNRPLIGSHADL